MDKESAREGGRVEEKRKEPMLRAFIAETFWANIAVINVVPAQDHNNLAQI